MRHLENLFNKYLLFDGKVSIVIKGKILANYPMYLFVRKFLYENFVCISRLIFSFYIF